LVLGYDRRLFLLPLEQPGEPVAGRSDVPGGADVDDLEGVLLDALEHAATAAGIDVDEVAVLVDGTLGAEVAREVTARRLTLAVPVDDRAEERFTFAHGEGFARHIETLGPDLSSVRVRWHPDDDPDVKKEQALGLTKLAAWLHETERRLLVELLVAETDAGGAADVGGTSRVPEAVREIRGLGIEADVWSLPGPLDRDQAQALGEVVADEGRDRVAAIVRLQGIDRIEPVAAACAGIPAYRGVVLGPDAWSTEVAALAAGEVGRDETVHAIGERLARTIELFSAAGPS
jgi:5-dehydro-2-deoxygluconokinase